MLGCDMARYKNDEDARGVPSKQARAGRIINYSVWFSVACYGGS